MKEHSRTALLIGVGDSPGAEHCFPTLGPTVDADLGAMSAALKGSGYEVQTLRDPTRNEITERITAVSRRVPAGSVLLLYFTGHGVRIGDIDYLVPSDARAPASDDAMGWQQAHVRESLLDADISRYLTICDAGTVLWLIDACRSAEDGRAVVFGSSITKGPPCGGFAVMSGCGLGERSGFAEAGSFFTLALARAFDPLTEASTVEEVYRAARQETRTLALRARSEPQAVLIRYGSDLEEETRTRKVAEGGRLLEAWLDVVRTPTLWKRVPECDTETVARIQDCLVHLATETARHVHRAQERLSDPWIDDEYPVRLLHDTLPLLLPEGVELSALEVAALIAGVLLHEAAWAERLSQAADLCPQSIHRRLDAGDQRRHYEQITEHHPQITEKLTDWSWWDTEPSDRSNDRNAVMLWLVHRWIAERFATDEEAVPAVLADGLVARLLDVTPPAPDGGLTGRAGSLSAALRTVAAGLALGAPRDDQRLPFPDSHVVRRVPRRLRVRPLAALLRLAGLLAFDARCLPEVVAEHLAVSDPVVPREVIGAIRDAAWHLDQDGRASYLHLDAVCRHPAIHAAMASVVEDADDLGYTLRETAQRLPADEGVLLKDLPARLTDQQLRPDRELGADAYDIPLARFSLAQTEIRRLLMGEKLYDGEPELALRELYQNAMDACRYRDMRVRYLRSCREESGNWVGRIRIAMGQDDQGRYVECIDNGVGMTADQLKSTFTQAGRRFEQSHSFRREQAAWLRHDRSLRLYPNSRFGIGVFSYFMLADEMTIVTRPVSPDGRPAEKALRVEIPVSGSLFRVREDDGRSGAALPEGGTRVRLYLRNSWTLTGESCVSVLRSLVHLSEFRLEVRGEGSGEQVWLPGRLQSGGGQHEIAVDSAIEAVPGTLWWVAGEGAIVCDGVATDRRTFGYVLNLHGAHAGELSINRKKLERYDTHWEHQRAHEGSQALADWPELTLEWLRTMESRHPSLARILWRAWHGRGVRARAGYGARTVNLDETGWFKLDSSLDNRSGWSEEEQLHDAVRPWRTAVLRPGPLAKREAAPESLDGHPVPHPGWSDIAAEVKGDWRSAVMVAHDQGMTVAEVLRATRGLRIAHPRLAGPAIRGRGDLEWKPDYTDRLIMTGLLGERCDPLGGFVVTVRGRRLSERKPRTEIYYRHLPEDLAGIVRTSAKHGLSLGELATMCSRYVPFVGEPLHDVPDHHRGHFCTENELTLLYLQEDEHSWRPATNPWDVPAVARAAGLDVVETQRRMADFAWLGRPVPDPVLTARWDAVPPEMFPVMQRYLVRGVDGRPVLPWAATIELAAEWEVSVWEADRVLARETEVLGVAHHRRYTKRSAGRDLVPSPGTGDLVGWLHGVDIRLEHGISLRDLAFVRPYELSWDELCEHVDELREAGVMFPDAARLLHAWDDLPIPSRYAFSGTDPSFLGADYPVPATSAVLFTASQQLRQELSFLWDTAHREARNLGLSTDLIAPPLPEELWKFRPTWDETAALIDQGLDDEYDEWLESPRWTALTAQHLVGYARARNLGARAAYQALVPLQAIGALVPELSPEAVAALPDEVPTAHDAVAVSSAHRVSTIGSPLVPLDLVSIAGRLGESVWDTWQRRITPYLALEGSLPSITEVPDVVPCWQDLAILSVGLDGRLPAVSGSVSRERLETCARAVAETEEWVRERLAAYAGMFGLGLEPGREQEEER
ncbi:caspase family protein [Streptomyces sp. NPDC008001]|uniref:HD domain-containing protein n=1 Tax=Streptomyces sp. NPDC008001 TaxID=3364804 RepID=UPI0036E7A9FA